MLFLKKLVLESLQELYKISLINHIIYSNTFAVNAAAIK